MNRLFQLMCLFLTLHFIGCVDSPTPSLEQPIATYTVSPTPVPPSLTLTLTPSRILDPTATDLPTATPIPTTHTPSPTSTSTPLPEPTVAPSVFDSGHLLFLWSPDEPCEYRTPVANYGLYKASWQGNEWQIEKLGDGFFEPRLRISPDGRKIAIYSSYTLDGSDVHCSVPISYRYKLTIFDVQSETFTEFQPSNNLFNGFWSYDSRKLYSLYRNTIVVFDVESGTEATLLVVPGYLAELGLSRQKDLLAVSDLNAPGAVNLYLYDDQGKQVTKLLSEPYTDPVKQIHELSWSRDERWLAVKMHNSEQALFLLDPISGERILTGDHGTQLRWSPVANHVAYITRAGVKIFSPESGYLFESQLDDLSSNFLWSWDGSHLYTVQRAHRSWRNLIVVDVLNREERVVAFPAWKVTSLHGWLDHQSLLVSVERVVETRNHDAPRFLAALSLQTEQIHPIHELSSGTHINTAAWVIEDRVISAAQR